MLLCHLYRAYQYGAGWVSVEPDLPYAVYGAQCGLAVDAAGGRHLVVAGGKTSRMDSTDRVVALDLKRMQWNMSEYHVRISNAINAIV